MEQGDNYLIFKTKRNLCINGKQEVIKKIIIYMTFLLFVPGTP